MKTNYAAEYMAAVLSSEMSNSDKLAEAVAECRRLGLDVLPPDVNGSEAYFNVPPGTEQIRFGLSAIKNVGEGAVAKIVAARTENGPFTSPLDFCRRVDSAALSRDALECMIKAGAFDSMGLRRSQLIASLDMVLSAGARIRRDQALGQEALFGQEEEVTCEDLVLPDIPEYTRDEIIDMERLLLGIAISYDPMAELEKMLEGHITAFSTDLAATPERDIVTVGGAVRRFRRFDTRRGPMLFVTIEDPRGQMELIVFSNVLSQCGDCVKNDEILIAKGRVSHKDRTGEEGRTEAKVVCDEITTLSSVSSRITNSNGGRVHIRINGNGDPNGDFLGRLAGIFTMYRGTSQVLLHIVSKTRSRKMVLGDSYRLDASNPGLVHKIEELLGPNAMWVD